MWRIKQRRIAAVALALASLFMLADCGGGGGGGSNGGNGSGGNGGVVVNGVPRFAYVANNGDGTVSMYTANAVTGQLRHNGYVAAGTGPLSVAVDPSGKFAYVANSTPATSRSTPSTRAPGR